MKVKEYVENHPNTLLYLTTPLGSFSITSHKLFEDETIPTQPGFPHYGEAIQTKEILAMDIYEKNENTKDEQGKSCVSLFVG